MNTQEIILATNGAIEDLQASGYNIGFNDGTILICNEDGAMKYGIRGWQWEILRNILVEHGLDYHIVSLEGESICLEFIDIQESLDY